MTDENVNTPATLGKHTGRAALADCIKRLGHDCNAELLVQVFEAFKKLTEQQETVCDDDILELLKQQEKQSPKTSL